ncbi:ABC transporter substrate-binding protein [Dictyobacter arantiisoli]|uniref:Sugar ABC transporter substrate-binding protein n=1 Tax=Dictyobacter arantiisoli TaxID=2014874 RepID=A0A5A5TB22_9CHLR|nr:extracellular solute-binding protein [Dictyobacter arantiisoli]GCF08104.1 sugar ABC transporter substrate-binding protein [Dictyobacter arantiisoli]
MSQNQSSSNSFTRRRFLQYSGGLALSGSLLAACAGTGAGGGGTANGNSNLPNLTQWYHQYGEKGTEQAVRSYAKNYTKANVTVKWVAGVGNAYGNSVNTALLGSSAPDIFEQSALSVDQVKQGLLAPLDDIFAAHKDDFLPASVKPFTVNGHVYAIKMLNDPTFIYYRKSMFQKANITKIPTTIDELIDAAKKVSAANNVKSIYIGPDAGVDALHQIAIWASGPQQDLLSADNKVIFNTDRVANMYLKIHELNATGNVLPDATDFWWSINPFLNGSVAMQWCGLWAMPQVVTALKDDFGIFPLPGLDAQSDPATVDGGWAEMVYAKGKNVAAAKAYVESLWIDNATVQKDWNVAYGFHIPPRVSTSAQTDKLKTGPAADAVNILNKYGHSATPYWNAAMETYLEDAVSKILKGGGTASNAKTLLDQAAEKCNTELQKEL